jgi:hypothetical protein
MKNLFSAVFTQSVSFNGGFDALGMSDSVEGWENKTQNAIAAGIIGGTASVIGGGKFANGAKTAAMSRLFNDLGEDAQKGPRHINSQPGGKNGPTITLITAGLHAPIQGAIAGAVSGFIGSGGSLKAAFVGGITGAAFGAIGDKFTGVKSFADKGAMNKLFLHAGFTQAVSLGGGFKAMGLENGVKDWDGLSKNAIAAGVVGGTASVIGGGKFANGAMTGAMSRMFNDLAHDETAQQTNDQQKQAKNSLNADASKGNPTVTGSVEAGGQVFGGVIGASVSTGLTGDTLNPNACTVTTSCVQFGLGVFAGAGGSMGGGVSSEALRSGTTESFGIFGNIGAFGAAAGGSLNFGGGSAGGAKGFLGVGKGISGGVQFCQSSLSCLRN